MAIQINLRVAKTLRDKLQEDAEKHGVSTNREINRRLEESFALDNAFGNLPLRAILQVVAAAMTEAGQSTGFSTTFTLEGAANWHDNPAAYDQAFQAAIAVLDALRPQGDRELKTVNGVPGELAEIMGKLGVGFANAMIEEAATGETKVGSDEARARAHRLHEGIGLLALRQLDAPKSHLAIQVLRPEKIK